MKILRLNSYKKSRAIRRWSDRAAVMQVPQLDSYFFLAFFLGARLPYVPAANFF
jgi:hypothetical protein